MSSVLSANRIAALPCASGGSIFAKMKQPCARLFFILA